jgi:hypothetical protein
MPTLQVSAPVSQNFLAKSLGHASVGDGSLYCIERRLSVHLEAFRLNSMSIRAITCEQKGKKAILLFLAQTGENPIFRPG